MSTEYQNSMENMHAPAQDLSFDPGVSTRKVFVKRFNYPSFEKFAKMHRWCLENLYHGGHYEPNWSADYPDFYFHDEKEYTLFLLRWS